ncbi:MAG TPA: hypothetical protein RMH99_31895 [Sandaracinaceae bacterium LLY-WYZ-13_1]|nr:hypothetical protein [Sandaracinaceae bacterium LLY-WYZ-13_1]
MGMDKTPPRNRLIAFYTALAVATLMSLKPAFDAYFDRMKTSAVEDRLNTYTDLDARYRAQLDWARSLCRRDEIQRAHAWLREEHPGEQFSTECTGASIEDRMDQLARRGRTAMPAIRPEAPAEMNMDPLVGWAEMPNEVPETPSSEVEALEPEMLDVDLAPPGAPGGGGPALEGLELQNPLQGLEPPAVEGGGDAAEPARPRPAGGRGGQGAQGGRAPSAGGAEAPEAAGAPTPSPEPAADPTDPETE